MKQAVILAAGEGRRLRPFTVNKPKAMISIAGAPILQYVVESLAQNGIRDIVLTQGMWNCATTRAQLSVLSTSPPFGFANQYALPSDFLRFKRFQEDNFETPFAIEAVSNPGECFEFRGVSYGVRDDVLYCHLPSGRNLTYIAPRLMPAKKPWGRPYTAISYMGWNTDPKKGPPGWIRLDTYGGKLTENVVQALARDVQVNGMLNVERAGYPLVLHVHDESASQVKRGFGSIEDYERLLSMMPPWAATWPIRASGGWRGRSYRKD